ncbi:hypothetical protein ASG52_21315 [Methylobacterium sp. Leaf456]|nr:hypothetical protein ASG52_21315 [Methylobacterium sp. Leaf456]
MLCGITSRIAAGFRPLERRERSADDGTRGNVDRGPGGGEVPGPDERQRPHAGEGSQGGRLCEGAIRLPDEGGFDAAIRLAREESQRIGSLVAPGDRRDGPARSVFGNACGPPETRSGLSIAEPTASI